MGEKLHGPFSSFLWEVLEKYILPFIVLFCFVATWSGAQGLLSAQFDGHSWPMLSSVLSVQATLSLLKNTFFNSRTRNLQHPICLVQHRPPRVEVLINRHRTTETFQARENMFLIAGLRAL